MHFSMLLGALICIALVSAATLSKNKQSKKEKRQSQDDKAASKYDLPSGVEEVVDEDVKEEFECGDKIYGYYADMANNCQIFHVCIPPNRMYSFFCANQTVFDQRSLICVHPNEAPPCEESEKYYSINENFGVTDDSQLVKFDS